MSFGPLLMRAKALLAKTVTGPLIRTFPMRFWIAISRSLAVLAVPFSPLFSYLGLLQRLSGRSFTWSKRLATVYWSYAANIERGIWRYKDSAWGNPQQWIEITDQQLLKELGASERGLIIMTLHCSTSVLLFAGLLKAFPDSPPCLLRSFPRKGPYKGLNHVNELIFRLFSGNVLNTNSTGDILHATRSLVQKGKVIILPDVFSRYEQPVPFLGYPLPFNLGASRLAEMTDALILPAICIPSFSRHPWKIEFGEPIDPRQGNTQEKMLHALELLVTDYPEVWKRWKGLKSVVVQTDRGRKAGG